MRTIHKFPVASGLFHIHLPKGAKVLTVQTQGPSTGSGDTGEPKMWVLFDTDNETERRSFVTFPTGGDISSDTHLDYIGTFQLAGGNLIFHLFEIGRG